MAAERSMAMVTAPDRVSEGGRPEWAWLWSGERRLEISMAV